MSEQEIGLDVHVDPNKPFPRKVGEESSLGIGQNQVDLSAQAKTKSNDELVDLIIGQSQDQLLRWEEVQLPSQGLFYDGKIPDGKIQVRPMGLNTDKILATVRLAQSGQAIDEVYRTCIKFPTPDFDPLDLLVGDRMFILFYLRGITHGNMYEFSVTCTNENCKSVSQHEYDLNRLAENIRLPKSKKEPIKIKLPFLSEVTKRDIWVEARFMRGRDLQTMMRETEVQKRLFAGTARNAKTGGPTVNSNVLDNTIEKNLNLVIDSVVGCRDPHKITEFIKKLHARDTAVIRETLREAQPGIDTEILITCPQCQADMKIDLPVTESFFRPTESRGVRS